MSEDLIVNLRISAAIAGPRARELYLAAADEIERCHARLEIDHEFELVGADLVKRAIPYADRKNTMDAVECRDMTITMLEGKL
ncbi:MAG: hypothetical protein ACU0AU_06845 [Cognatishimia activa]